MVIVMRDFNRRAFTLLELLIVISIIVIVTAITLMAFRNVASNARMSAAVQEVSSILEQARARAIGDGRTTLVAFRQRVNAGGEHFVEAVVGQSSGESFLWTLDPGDPNATRKPATRFVPIGGIEPREMPDQIGFAVPARQFGDDELFVTTARVEVAGQAPGIIPAFMYGPDGEPVMYEQESDAALVFMDFNGDGGQRYQGVDYCNHLAPQSLESPPACPPDRRNFSEGYIPADGCYVLNERLDTGLVHPAETVFEEDMPLCQMSEHDEPFLVLATDLVMFDEKAARERYDSSAWDDTEEGAARRGRDLTEFIKETGRWVRLNRYTGVAQHGR